MSQKIIFDTLKGLGLTERDSEVFIFLAKKGPVHARDAQKMLRINKAQLYRSLKSLQAKGMVESTIEYPARFNAISFEQVIDMAIKAKKDETQKMQNNKEDTLTHWKNLAIQEPMMLQNKFMVIEGENYIYSKIEQMGKDAKKQILISASESGIIEAEKANLIKSMIELRIPLKILTNVTSKNLPIIERATDEIGGFAEKCQGRHIELAEKVFPRFVIRDEDELIFLIASGDTAAANQTSGTGLWTNNKSLVDAFRTFFEQLWRDAMEIDARVFQLKTGLSPPETKIIKDAQEAYEKFLSLLGSAQKEIILMTTAKGLIRALDHKSILEGWRKRAINVRIMAPITSENANAADQLSKYCSLKHIQISYLRSLVVDGKQLLHFKAPPADKETLDHAAYFENSFFTNDPEYVQGRKELLEELWNNSPSALENLKRSEARYRSLYENSYDAVMLTEPDGTVLSANPAAQRMFHMTENEIKKAGRHGLLVRDENAKKAIAEHLKTGKARAELTYKHKDGTVFQGETTSSRFIDADGNPKTSLIIRDITERKKIEKELWQFSAAIKASSDGIIMGDTEGYITDVNEALLKLGGSKTKKDFVGRHMTDFLVPEDKQRAREASEGFMRVGQGSTGQYRALKKDGSVVPIEVTTAFVRDEHGSKVGFVAIVRDISARIE